MKSNIIGISETRLQRITNIYLPNYVYEHIPTESSKGGILPYINKTLNINFCKDPKISLKRDNRAYFYHDF